MSTAVITDAEARVNIGDNIKALLKTKGWSQGELARQSNESAMNVSRIINGVNLPNAAILARLAEALEVSTDYLISRHGKNSKKSA